MMISTLHTAARAHRLPRFQAALESIRTDQVMRIHALARTVMTLAIAFIFLLALMFPIQAIAAPRVTTTVGSPRKLESFNKGIYDRTWMPRASVGGKLKVKLRTNVSLIQKSRNITKITISCPYRGIDKPTKMSSGILCLEDAPGMWFPWGVARLMIVDLTRGRNAIALLPALETQIAQHKSAIVLLRQQYARSEEISNKYKGVVTVQAKQLQRKDAWYKSPPLWFATGVVTTIIMGIVGAKIYQELN